MSDKVSEFDSEYLKEKRAKRRKNKTNPIRNLRYFAIYYFTDSYLYVHAIE